MDSGCITVPHNSLWICFSLLAKCCFSEIWKSTLLSLIHFTRKLCSPQLATKLLKLAKQKMSEFFPSSGYCMFLCLWWVLFLYPCFYTIKIFWEWGSYFRKRQSCIMPCFSYASPSTSSGASPTITFSAFFFFFLADLGLADVLSNDCNKQYTLKMTQF